MRLAVILALTCSLAACHDASSRQAPSPATEPLSTKVEVDKLEIAVGQSFPVQIRVLVQGHLVEACGLGEPVIELRGDSFFVDLHGSVAAGVDCEERQPFNRWISLPVHGLRKGVYKVLVNGQETSFTLSQDNI